MNSIEFKTLFERDLNKLINEVTLYTNDDVMWEVLPGTINSAGNLTQHLIGNLRTYIGLTLGKVPYTRNRAAEFGERLFTREGLLKEIALLKEIVTTSVFQLTDEDLKQEYPHEVLSLFPEQNIRIILIHLLTHLAYHTGQINYHRRTLCSRETE